VTPGADRAGSAGLDFTYAPRVVHPRLAIGAHDGTGARQPAAPAVRGLRYDHVKRGIDLGAALLLLLCLAPLLAACALLVRLDSPGPILFRQVRVGLHGRRFTMLKFRSMRHGADPAPHREFVAAFIRGRAPDGPGGGPPLFKLAADSRVTRVGRWLRRSSLDELPQLWNVVRGEMSLVGPRPPIPYEVHHYKASQPRRLDVRPGMTGLWQVSGRSRTTFDEMVALDLSYIESRSLSLDLIILMKTIPVVLFCKDAG
jgi:lipopolysaccharide/colanic/teichoic acid biosynthesis glycosyltransferase